MKKKMLALLIGGLIIGLSFSMVDMRVNAETGQNSKQFEIIEKNKKAGIIPLDKATAMFKELDEVHNSDNKRLWGIDLHSPILLIDYESGYVVGNEPDLENKLKKIGNVYVGKLSDDDPIANSTIEFGGKEWATAIYDQEATEFGLKETCLHEMFHNKQKELNLETGDFNNIQMDQMNARIYLKLEWNALNKALEKSGNEKKEAIRDALLFRKARRDEFNCAEDENKFEILEGLPEYTAMKLACKDEADLKQQLKKSYEVMLDEEHTPTYVRSFAYYSGVVYGLLLDEGQPDWRKKVNKDSDLGEMLKQSYNIDFSDTSVEKIKNKYNYNEVYKYELERNNKRQKAISEYENKFNSNKILEINLGTQNITFNPRRIWSLGDKGIVYEIAKINDDWGEMEVNGSGVLINDDCTKAIVSSKNIKIEGNKVYGENWSMELNSGYKIKQSDNSKYVLDKQ